MDKATVIINPADPKVQAIALKAHLRLQASGMKHSRLRLKDILDKASAITNKPYTRNKIPEAIADLQAIIDG